MMEQERASGVNQVGKRKPPWGSFREPLIEMFLERTGASSLSVGARFHPWLQGLNESESARLLSALDSACHVLGEHLARVASEEMGIELEATVHRVV